MAAALGRLASRLPRCSDEEREELLEALELRIASAADAPPARYAGSTERIKGIALFLSSLEATMHDAVHRGEEPRPLVARSCLSLLGKALPLLEGLPETAAAQLLDAALPTAMEALQLQAAVPLAVEALRRCCRLPDGASRVLRQLIICGMEDEAPALRLTSVETAVELLPLHPVQAILGFSGTARRRDKAAPENATKTLKLLLKGLLGRARDVSDPVADAAARALERLYDMDAATVDGAVATLGPTYREVFREQSYFFGEEHDDCGSGSAGRRGSGADSDDGGGSATSAGAPWPAPASPQRAPSLRAGGGSPARPRAASPPAEQVEELIDDGAASEELPPSSAAAAAPAGRASWLECVSPATLALLRGRTALAPQAELRLFEELRRGVALLRPDGDLPQDLLALLRAAVASGRPEAAAAALTALAALVDRLEPSPRLLLASAAPAAALLADAIAGADDSAPPPAAPLRALALGIAQRLAVAALRRSLPGAAATGGAPLRRFVAETSARLLRHRRAPCREAALRILLAALLTAHTLRAAAGEPLAAIGIDAEALCAALAPLLGDPGRQVAALCGEAMLALCALQAARRGTTLLTEVNHLRQNGYVSSQRFLEKARLNSLATLDAAYAVQVAKRRHLPYGLASGRRSAPSSPA